jgi:hypothetical protein
MPKPKNGIIKLKSAQLRSRRDVLRDTLVEELDELEGAVKYIRETCEYALQNHPEDMREWLSALESLNSECTAVISNRFFHKASGALDLLDELDD